MRAALTACLVGSATAAGASLSVKVGGVAVPKSTGPVMDARMSLDHISAHVFGFSSSADTVTDLPSTDILSRPSLGLSVTVEAGRESFLDGAVSVQLKGMDDKELLPASANWAWSRSTLTGSSLEVVAPSLSGASVPAPGTVLRWEAGSGFVVEGATREAGAHAGLTGNVACSPAGAQLLSQIGVKAIASNRAGGDGCPGYVLPDSEAVLDASVPEVAQALSEAAAIIGATSGAALPSGEVGLTMFRFYASGAAEAAVAGLPEVTTDALRRVLSQAIAAADASLARAAEAAGVTHATVVLSSHAVPAPSARRLQVSPDDPCIDFGNCTIVTPTVAPNFSRDQAAIEAYHVALWTAVLLAAILIASAYVLLGMDSRKDPALYVSLMDPRASAGKSQ